eukprot:TRINITY_DN14004_c0_g1_i1.p1 TRINITY_DN14004_c0_g1~~TRINITY_DN14004_c0_g1_i1.p1  ORF type:complete len:86 (-),score=12.71 TRINITY_DN14004_c0_g1_i1:93-350(-)
MEGDLASVHSDMENDVLKEMFTGGVGWLGVIAGKWADGSDASYHSTGSISACGLTTAGSWSSVACDDSNMKRIGICYIPKVTLNL